MRAFRRFILERMPLSLLRGLNEGLTNFFFLPDPPVGGIFAGAVGTEGNKLHYYWVV